LGYKLRLEIANKDTAGVQNARTTHVLQLLQKKFGMMEMKKQHFYIFRAVVPNLVTWDF